MPINPPRPQEPQGNPYTPPLPEPQIMEQFEGMNTAPSRAGVPDAQCYWIDGFFPYSPRKLRALPGSGSTIYTASGGKTVKFYVFYNIGLTAYCAVFLSDGSVIQVNTQTQATITIMPAGTIINPTITGVGFTQYGQQYLLICANQTNGYWIWDGALLYTAGTLAPSVTITNAGAAYISTPSVVFSGAHGTGASAVATVNNGVVTGIVITNPGSGYLAGDQVQVALSGGLGGGSGGSLTAVLTHLTGGSGASVTVTWAGGTYFTPIGETVTAGGSGYTRFAQGSWVGGSGGWFQNGIPGISLLITGGVITGCSLVPTPPNPDFAYSGASQPQISISDTGGFVVSSVTINNAGSNYSPSTEITVAGGSVVNQAALLPIIVSGTISSVQITSPGLYSASTPVPTLTVTDLPVTASASVQLMPFAISGNALSTYSGHVWLASGPIVYFSAPGSPSNFATSAGGGNFTSNSNVLRVGYTQLINTNGFLYLIGDSSMDYISGVTTSGNPITTSYTLQNADPEVGTPYPASVLTLGPDIVLANSFGVHVSRGAALEKISEPLDGVYNSVGNFGGLQLASAKATIFNRRCYMLLEQIVNPVSGATINQLMMWDGGKKWWSSAQDFSSLTFIATQEINSVLTAYGTDGTNIKPLFQTATTGFQKVVQSRFWDAPGGYQFTKATGRFWSVWKYNTNSSPNLIVDIDAITINGSNGSTTLTTQGYTITGPASSGYFVTPPQAVGQQGIFAGMTLKTSEGDVELVSAMIQSDPKISYRG